MFKRFLFFGIIILSWMLLTSVSHKFYVSITQIDINKDSFNLEISSRIFSDDLEASVLEESGQKLWLGTEKEHPKADSILFNYLQYCLNFEQDGNNLELIFIGKEVEADVTWIYLESMEGLFLEKGIEIHNSILNEQFSEQKNIVNLRYGKKTISQIHTKSHPEYSYQTE